MTLNRVAIVGLGLLGGSIGKELKNRRLANKVLAYARREQTVEEGLSVAAADEISTDLFSIVSEADFIILCTPVYQMGKLGSVISEVIKEGTIITDVGSVKSHVTQEMEHIFESSGSHFVGSHPMAGSEKTGVLASQLDLFKNATCVVTPTPNTQENAKNQVIQFWESIGGKPIVMDPTDHDELVARCSHIPHVLSSALSMFVLDPKWPEEQSHLSGTGFRDISRLASGSPEMWKDISLSNRSAILQAMDEWSSELQHFKSALENKDEPAILSFFAEAKNRRDIWLKSFQK